MLKKKSVLTYILAICLIIPTMFMLSACGGKKFSYLSVNFSNQDSNYLTLDYGNNAGLGDFDILAYYSDNSTEELNLNDVTIKIDWRRF